MTFPDFPFLVYDPQAEAAYLHLSTQERVCRTVYTPANVDLDLDGNIVGIELLEWYPEDDPYTAMRDYIEGHWG
jgi:hypothetical protein